MRPRDWVAGAGGWLFAPGDARRLAGLRIGLAGVLAVRVAAGPYLELAEQPRVLYRPQALAFMNLLPAMPSRGVVLVLQILAVVLAVLALAGYRARVTLPGAWLAALPLVGMTTSLGKVAHNDVLLLLCLVPLLPARCGDAWSLDALRRARSSAAPAPATGAGYGWPVRAAMVVVAGSYFFSGWGKLLYAGPDWVLGGNLRWILYASSDAQATPNALALFVADRPWLAHLVAGATLLLELAFPLVLRFPALGWLLVPGAVAMHAGIWAAMGLDYWGQVATVIVVMVNWPRVPGWSRVLRRPATARSRAGYSPSARLGKRASRTVP